MLSCRGQRPASGSRCFTRRLHSSAGRSAHAHVGRVLPHPAQDSLLRSGGCAGRTARARSVVRHRAASAALRSHAELQVQLDGADRTVARIVAQSSSHEKRCLHFASTSRLQTTDRWTHSIQSAICSFCLSFLVIFLLHCTFLQFQARNIWCKNDVTQHSYFTLSRLTGTSSSFALFPL